MYFINLEISPDNGNTFHLIDQYIPVLDSVYKWRIPDSLQNDQFYLLRAVDTYTSNVRPDTSEAFYIKSNIIVNAGKR